MTAALERITPERFGVQVALAYATADNFTGKPVYRPDAGAWLHPDAARLLDQTVEIPVYGLPYAHNAATATAMALYEFCRQYPRG